MTTEERREQAEKEVREKLGWEIVGNARCFDHYDEKHAVDATRAEIDAYNLVISQATALAEAKERIAELEKVLGLEHDAMQRIVDFRKHAWGCKYEMTEFCTCGMKETMDDVRFAFNTAVDALQGTHQEEK